MHHIVKVGLIGVCLWWLSSYLGLIEGWASSPGTMIQLAAGSSYYPMWYPNYGYRYPYYRFSYPYYNRYPIYESHGFWPRPNGYYNL